MRWLCARMGEDTVEGRCRGLLIFCKVELKASEFDGEDTFVECAGVTIPWGGKDLKILVLGDLNMSGIDWEMIYSDKAGERVLLEVVQGLFWTQHVNFPTLEDGNLLDVVLSSCSELEAGVSDEGKLFTADQSMIKVEIVGTAFDKDSTEMVPDWGKDDMR